MAKTWRRLAAKARQQLSDERLIGVENYGLKDFTPPYTMVGFREVLESK
jgi:hypothetical protein